MFQQPEGEIGPLAEHLFRRQAGMMISTLTRILGPRHIDLAEEAVQEALVRALQRWPLAGLPDSPTTWLIHVAKNYALDHLRHDATMRTRAEAALRDWSEAVTVDPQFPAGPPLDDVLGMMFMCCHPELSRDARIALTLKTVVGLGVPEIGRAFLAREEAVAQRIVRAKRQIRDQGLAFELPSVAEMPRRLESVLEVLYLLFSEGYGACDGDELVRADLGEEAIRLCALVTRHPGTDRPKCHALLALMLFHAARFPTRVDGEGELLLLAEQDRHRWDRDLVDAALRHLASATAGLEVSSYHLEAGIAACHAVASSYEATDWGQIVDLYDRLYSLQPSPLIALNRAVAVSRRDGPEAGIREVERVKGEPVLVGYYLLPAVLGELSRERGDAAAAVSWYRQALTLRCSAPERRFLARRLASLGGPLERHVDFGPPHPSNP